MDRLVPEIAPPRLVSLEELRDSLRGCVIDDAQPMDGGITMFLADGRLLMFIGEFIVSIGEAGAPSLH